MTGSQLAGARAGVCGAVIFIGLLIGLLRDDYSASESVAWAAGAAAVAGIAVWRFELRRPSSGSFGRWTIEFFAALALGALLVLGLPELGISENVAVVVALAALALLMPGSRFRERRDRQAG